MNTKHNEYYAAITLDEQRLYFVSDRPGGLGGKDIWYCNKLPNGQWGKAINLGSPINTAFDEDAPFLHPDGKTMFFSSNGRRSMGGYDIFRSEMKEGEWQAPQNLSYPINTTDDDHNYITSPSGRRAYYSSKGSGSIGSTDIYVIEYPETSPTPQVDMSGFAVIKGWVLTGQTEFPSDLKIYITDSETGEQKGLATPVSRNGSFVFIVPSGKDYNIDYTLNNDTLIAEHIHIPVGSQYQELKREVILSPDKNGQLEAVVLDEKVLNPAKSGRVRIGEQGIIPIGSKILYLDAKDNVIHTVYVSKDGFFEFKPLDKNTPVILQAQVPGYEDQDLDIALQDQAAETSIQLALSSGRFNDAKLIELAKNVESKEANKPSQKNPEHTGESLSPTRSVQFTFGYNQNQVPTKGEAFQAFLSTLKEELQNGNKVHLIIERSASKVPTRSFASNEALAKHRSEVAQKQVIEELKSAGIDTNKMLTIELKHAVNGPEYTIENRDDKFLFTDFQYVKMNLN